VEQAATKGEAAAAEEAEEEELPIDYDEPEDAVIHIKPRAMRRLRELRAQQQQQKEKAGQTVDEYLVLRMGVRNGGCSGMSYVMDFDTMESVNEEDDTVDTYEGENIQCVVDSKSLLYLYGLELDYSDALVGGGFKVILGKLCVISCRVSLFPLLTLSTSSLQVLQSKCGGILRLWQFVWSVMQDLINYSSGGRCL